MGGPSKEAPAQERLQHQGLGDVTPPLPLTRRVTLAMSPAPSLSLRDKRE